MQNDIDRDFINENDYNYINEIYENESVKHSDLWWFVPVQGNILYKDGREKFRYRGYKLRFY